ncbi:MAG: hydrogenase maturation protease [Cyclobacteriaceae bacterium]
MNNKPLIIGVGNPLRGDDAFGYAVVTSMKAQYPNIADYKELTNDFSSVPYLWKNRNVVVIDSLVCQDKAPGTIIQLFDATSLSYEKMVSSHGFSIKQSLDISEVLDLLPDRIALFGIVGKYWCLGAPMSEELINQTSSFISQIKHYVIGPEIINKNNKNHDCIDK